MLLLQYPTVPHPCYNTLPYPAPATVSVYRTLYSPTRRSHEGVPHLLPAQVTARRSDPEVVIIIKIFIKKYKNIQTEVRPRHHRMGRHLFYFEQRRNDRKSNASTPITPIADVKRELPMLLTGYTNRQTKTKSIIIYVTMKKWNG